MTDVIHHDADRLELYEADIRRQPDVLTKSIPQLREEAIRVAADLGPPPSRVYLVGCGDSFDGGVATRPIWERLCRMPVEPVPAMSFSTSLVDDAPRDALVVALSQSGKVSRVVEAVRAAGERGLRTVAITAKDDSPLAVEPTTATWTMAFDKLGAIPGTTSHVLGAVALAELGCAISDDEPGAPNVRQELDALPELVGVAVDASFEAAERHVGAIERELPLLSLGYGPCLSSARYTIRKLLELTQLMALWQETEEYAHDEYSLVDARFRVIEFAPPDRGGTRNLEIARYLHRLDVHLAVVTEPPEAEAYRSLADVVYAMPTCPPVVRPMLYAVPGQVLSLMTARRIGGSLYGMAERFHREDGDPQIYQSGITT